MVKSGGKLAAVQLVKGSPVEVGGGIIIVTCVFKVFFHDILFNHTISRFIISKNSTY